MYIIDQSDFPVVRMITRGHATVEETEGYFSVWNSLLDRQEKFGVLIMVEPGDESKRDNQVANMTAKWLKEARSRLAQYCGGIATLVPDQEYRDRHAHVVEARGLQIYGCPCKVYLTSEEAEARQWLLGLLKVGAEAGR